MKPILMLALCLLANSTANASPRRHIHSCQLTDGSRIELLAEPASDGHRFFLKFNGRIDKAFTDMPESDFVGDVALAACVDHALIFAMSYGPPYLKGVAIRKNPETREVERIDFAEKALPRWLYQNSKGMKLVIPNLGNEVSARYLLYSVNTGTRQPEEAEAVNDTPATHGYQVKGIPSVANPG